MESSAGAASLPFPVGPAAQPEDEGALIARARTEKEAFAELYRRHYEAIGSYLFRRTGDRHATEDLLSEVFLGALRGLPRYRYKGIAFRHWLYRIATHAANRWAKKNRRKFAPLEVSSVAPESNGDDLEELHAHLLRLPPHQQAVVALHYLEGLSVDEIATTLGTRPGTVKSRLARARQTLRARLEGGRS